MKCKKLIVKNYYKSGKPLIVLGKILKIDNFSLKFITGKQKVYNINRFKEYLLLDTDEEYAITATGVGNMTKDA